MCNEHAKPILTRKQHRKHNNCHCEFTRIAFSVGSMQYCTIVKLKRCTQIVQSFVSRNKTRKVYTEIYVYVMSIMAALMTTKRKRALTTENYVVDTICNNEKEAETDK